MHKALKHWAETHDPDPAARVTQLVAYDAISDIMAWNERITAMCTDTASEGAEQVGIAGVSHATSESPDEGDPADADAADDGDEPGNTDEDDDEEEHDCDVDEEEHEAALQFIEDDDDGGEVAVEGENDSVEHVAPPLSGDVGEESEDVWEQGERDSCFWVPTCASEGSYGETVNLECPPVTVKSATSAEEATEDVEKGKCSSGAVIVSSDPDDGPGEKDRFACRTSNRSQLAEFEVRKQFLDLLMVLIATRLTRLRVSQSDRRLSRASRAVRRAIL